MPVTKMFVELFQLNTKNNSEQWSASSRWLKYEQCIEGVDNRWSRPRVSLVPYEGVIQFRQLMSTGLLILDPNVRNFNQLEQILIANVSSEFNIEIHEAERFVQILSKVKFRHDQVRSTFQKIITVPSKQPLSESISLDPKPPTKQKSFKGSQSMSANHFRSTKRKPTLIKQLTSFSFEAEHPIEAVLGEDAEATQIYTGCLPQQAKVRFIMIRLSNALYLPELMEPIVNVRFLFVVLGPTLSTVDYHNVGRAIGTLMTNKKFRQVALKANRREDIISEINNYLNETLIIPPGEIDKRALLTADEVEKILKKRKMTKDIIVEESNEHLSEELKTDQVSIGLTPDAESKSVVLVEVPNPLIRTGRPFGGLINDIKHRFPFYIDDFKSAFTFQCVTATIFVFFANFASAVAFGDVIGNKTNGLMGVTEILLAHGLCNVVWGLVSGQPLCILASVGPFLVFETSLFMLCNQFTVDFLAVRFWIGLWTFLFMVLWDMVEAPFVMKYLTRFTEDIFTSLIAVIYIWEAIKYVRSEFYKNPVQHIDNYCMYCNDTVSEQSGFSLSKTIAMKTNNTTGQPDTSLLALIFVASTFTLAYALKKLRNSIFCGRTVKKALGDFGLPITVILMTCLDRTLFHETYRKHVFMPVSFNLTNSSARNWIINPIGSGRTQLPLWAIPACAVPAILVAILLYAEVEIIEGLLYRKERCLKKPTGFHWDLVVAGALTFVCGVFGLQWMCPAAVQTISHANALSVMRKTAPGERAKINYVIEQRVTVILVGILHAATTFMGTFINLIPTSILFGLFLYLGFVGLSGIQFYQRIILIFVPKKYLPNEIFCMEVSMYRMHLFTILQLCCFFALWTVNMWPTSALLFPFILIIIGLFRNLVLPKIFNKQELNALDGTPESEKQSKLIKEEEEEKDFYEQAAVPL